jgi:hypothetical protein
MQTWKDLEREARDLAAQGLRGEAFLDALTGGRDPEGLLLRTPEELAAYIEQECGYSVNDGLT